VTSSFDADENPMTAERMPKTESMAASPDIKMAA